MPMPIPLVEPVTMTTLSFSLFILVSPFAVKLFILIEKIGLTGPPLTDSIQRECVMAAEAAGSIGWCLYTIPGAFWDVRMKSEIPECSADNQSSAFHVPHHSVVPSRFCRNTLKLGLCFRSFLVRSLPIHRKAVL